MNTTITAVVKTFGLVLTEPNRTNRRGRNAGLRAWGAPLE